MIKIYSNYLVLSILTSFSFVFFQCSDEETPIGIIGTWACQQVVQKNCSNPDENNTSSCMGKSVTFNEDETWFDNDFSGTYTFENDLLTLELNGTTGNPILVTLSGNTIIFSSSDNSTNCDVVSTYFRN